MNPDEILEWLRFLRDAEVNIDNETVLELDARVDERWPNLLPELFADWQRARVRLLAIEEARAAEGLIEPVIVEKDEEDPEDVDAPNIPVPALQPHEIDIPEEPEQVRVISTEWDFTLRAFAPVDFGVLMLVPSGCDRPLPVSPYKTSMDYRSPLPRDKEKDANLFGAYQTNGWVDRKWVRDNLDEDIDGVEVDKGIADDVPVMMALKGTPTAGVSQTPGMDPGGAGSNNGAPLPPGPGPGRGNRFSPGDGLG